MALQRRRTSLTTSAPPHSQGPFLQLPLPQPEARPRVVPLGHCGPLACPSHVRVVKAVRLPTQSSDVAGFSDLKEATTSETPPGAVGRRSENVQRSQALGHRAFSRARGFQV